MTPQEMIAAAGKDNPLTAFYDADPAGWLPNWYTEYVDLDVAVNSQATMVFQLQFAPFIWTHVVHTLAGNIGDPESSGLYNDGQYLVRMSDERRQYTNKPTPANLLSGPHGEGPFAEMQIPVFFPANHAINVELTNLWTRVLNPPSDTFRVYFTLKGLSYWGQLKVPDNLLALSQGR